jgi:hypothetical protein
MGGFVMNLKQSFSETTKKSLTIGVMIFAAFISVIFMTFMAFGASGEGQDPTCGVLDWNAKCQLSPTGHMLFGDVITGGSIALFLSWFFHRLSSKNTLKIEQLMDTEQNLRNRRKDYGVSHLKNLLSLLFFTINLLKGSLTHYNRAAKLSDDDRKLWLQSTYLSRVRADEAKMGRILISVRNILVAANDVLEPELVKRIEGVCNFIGELSAEENQDGTMDFPKMGVSRIKVKYLLELLNTYSVTTHSLADIEEHYESPGNVPKGAFSGGSSSGVMNQEVQH